ncbi:ecotin family protein [Flavobacterium sp. JP2137]|uniref:ecotin family protein n=1 Tax=Flavobacterium sp. JP2137 TaxID=3414510 RepID=UPI003D2F9D25
MKKTSKLLFFTLLCAISTGASAQDKGKASMFPKAKEGYRQVVIDLPPIKKGENNYKVEVFVGKVTGTDSCNNYSLMGELSPVNLDGWGYTYYNFDSESRIIKTLMMCPDDKKISKFVHDQGTLLDYNSKLPLVVYVNDDLEVRYKIWKTDGKWANKPLKVKK